MKATLTSLALAAIFWNLLLRPGPSESATLWVVCAGGPAEHSLDVLFAGDGYRQSEAERYRQDVDHFSARLLEERPFCWYRERINIRAVFAPSRESGCDASRIVDDVDTLLGSSFDGPDGRLLSFGRREKLAALVAAAGDADIVLVLVNTRRYGGAGSVLKRAGRRPLPAPTFAAHAPGSFLIALHELGHSFAGLADAYADEGLCASYPLPGAGDLPHPNATMARCVDASSPEALARTLKWGHFLRLPGARRWRWLHEGGHYRAKGVLRPWRSCRMRDPTRPFCPVCTEAMARAITAACGEPWDDATYHRRHPLVLWRPRRGVARF